MLLHEYRCQYYDDCLHGALFEAVSFCSNYRLGVPIWCTKEIEKHWRRYRGEKDTTIFEHLNVRRHKNYRRGSSTKNFEVGHVADVNIREKRMDYDPAAEAVAEVLHVTDRTVKRHLKKYRNRPSVWSEAIAAHEEGNIEMRELQRIAAEHRIPFASRTDFGRAASTAHYSITRQTLLEIFNVLYVEDSNIESLPRFRRSFSYVGPVHDFEEVTPRS